VIDVDQHASARGAPAATMRGSSGITCPVWNITCETTTRSAPASIALSMLLRRRTAHPFGLDERERDAAAPRVFAQDDVERIELPACGEDARRAIVRVEHRAQTLPRARLRHDAIGTRRAGERREARAERRHLACPVFPCIAHAGVPRGKSFADVVRGCVERTAERVIGEIDPAALLREHAREERRNAFADERLGQRTGAELHRRCRRSRPVGRHELGLAPM
jgi:hypothetical protein